VRFWLRWLANGIAIFLALYLADSLLHARFHLEATWAGVLAAIVLGFINGLVRPLHRARSKPHRAVLAVILTVLVNALVLQLFVWTGADLQTRGFLWVLLAAAFVTLLAGLINWQVGFHQRDKSRTSLLRDKPGRGSGAGDGRKPARS
jgi:putative membrane protein